MKQLFSPVFLLISVIFSSELLAHGAHDHSNIMAGGSLHMMPGSDVFLLMSSMLFIFYLIVRRT